MIRILTLIFFITSSITAEAKDTIVGGFSSKNISINTTFTGSKILIFGSIKRNNAEKITPSHIIIEVLGPRTNITIRKKKKTFGIWINSHPIKIYNSPSFYSLLFTDKPEKILAQAELKNTLIGKKQFFDPQNNKQSYIDAINAKIRIKIKEGSYIFHNDPIALKDETLFSAQVSLPANLIQGDYKTKIHLVQNGKVISSFTDIIKVRKIGIEKWLYQMAHEQSLFYGLFSIFLALFFGWSASTLFRKFQK